MKGSAIIELFDFLSYQPKLFIRKQQRYNTIIGLIVSIIALISIVSLALYFFLSFLLGTEMTVIFSKENISKPLLFNFNQKLNMFGLTDANSKIVDPRVAYLQAVHWIFKEKVSEKKIIPLETCQLGRHFSQKDYDAYMSYKLMPSNYFCFSPDYNLSLSYDSKQIHGSYIYLYVVKCINSTLTNDQCFDINKVNETLASTTLYLSYTLDTINIDHSKSSYPIHNQAVLQNRIISTTNKYDYFFKWKYVEYSSDNGWLFNSIATQSDYEFDDSLTEILLHSDDKSYFIPNAFSSLQLYFSTTFSERYQRSYPKLQTIIARVTGLIDIIILFGQYVVYLFTLGNYYVDSVFQLGDSNKSINNNNSSSKKPRIKIKSLFSPKNVVCNSKRSIELIKEIKVAYCDAFKWKIIPKLSEKTKYVSLCQNKVSEMLSVDYLIGKIFKIDKAIQTISHDNQQQFYLNQSLLSNNNNSNNSNNKSIRVQESNSQNQQSNVLILNSICN